MRAGLWRAHAQVVEDVLGSACRVDVAERIQRSDATRGLRGGSRDDVAVVVLGDGKQAVHSHHVLSGHADGLCNFLLWLVAQVDIAHVGAHSDEAAQRLFHWHSIACGEKTCEVLQRNTHVRQRGEEDLVVLAVIAGGAYLVHDGRKWRDVPDHRQRAVLRVQRKRDVVLEDEVVDWRVLRGIDPGVRDAFFLCGSYDSRVVRVQHDGLLRFKEVLIIRRRGSLGHAIGIVEDDAQVAQAAHAGFRANRGLAYLKARVAERTFLGLAGLVIEVNLLIRAARDTHAPAAALVLIHEHDAVFSALVHRAGRARRHAGGVHAMLADAWQVEHEGVLDLLLYLQIHLVQGRVLVHGLNRTTQVVIPVGRPLNLVYFAAIDLRDRLCGGLGLLTSLGTHQILVLVAPRLVVVLDGRQVRVMEQGSQLLQASTGLGFELARAGKLPAALPLFLVLPGAGVAHAGTSFNVIEPDVLGAFAVGPCLLTRDRTGVAADALVQVHDHGDLGHDFH